MANESEISNDEFSKLVAASNDARARLQAVLDPQPVPQRVGPEFFQPMRFMRAESDEQRERRERETQRRDEERIKSLRARSCELTIPSGFSWALFESLDLVRAVKQRSAILQARALKHTEQAVFVGPSGTGKTALAAAASRIAIRDHGCNVVFESAFRLAIARSRYELGKGEPDIVRAAFDAELLVLDELGSDELVHGSAVREIIFERHWRARPTWVTTWMTFEDVGAKYGDGMARRVFQRAVTVDCTPKRAA